MTAQIVSYGFGKHNENPEQSAARVMQGATWKKQRVIVLLPASNTISTKVALSHWNLIFPPNQGVYRMLCLGMEVGDAYTQAIQAILAHGDLRDWEYILTLEHDNMPPTDGLLKLIERMDKHPEYSCIGGLYWTKGEGGQPQIWGDPGDPVLNFRPQVPRPGELQECNGTGMGFSLWRISTFKDAKLRQPWFKTVAGREGVGTQDLYFWGDARKHGHRCAIDNSVSSRPLLPRHRSSVVKMKSAAKKKPVVEAVVAPALIKIDLGCGPNKKEGFVGLDKIEFPGVDHNYDIGKEVWPFADGAVEEAYSSHFVEHLTAVERVHFCNELYRVLIDGGKCTLIVPHWNNLRAYGDPTHQWPPVSEFWFYYLDKSWRAQNAPHADSKNWDKGYACDFLCTWGYSMDGEVTVRSSEHQQFAMKNYTNAIIDIHATMTKRA